MPFAVEEEAQEQEGRCPRGAFLSMRERGARGGGACCLRACALGRYRSPGSAPSPA